MALKFLATFERLVQIEPLSMEASENHELQIVD